MIVIGVGLYGIAFVIILVRNGHEVVFWGYDFEYIVMFECDCCNVVFFFDVFFFDMFYFESDFVIVLVVSCNIFVVVFSYVFGEVLCQIKLLMCFDVCLVWVIKGLEVEIGCLLQDVVCEVLGD